jgi:dienelactone hydrolase
VDPGRVALIGWSLGAHLAPRAASAEHRLAACLADCGSYDLFDAALQQIPDPVDYLRALRDYSLKDHAGKITCPVLVCDAEGDDVSASAPQLAAALASQQQYLHFTAAEGAGDHCETGARTLYHARSFGWLDDILHPEAPAAP